MRASIESTTTIARSPEDVFHFLLDLDKHPTDPGVESVVKTPDGPTRAGTTFHFAHEKGRQTTMRFTAVEPNRRIEFKGKVGPLEPAGNFNFEPTDGQTRLTVRVAPNPVGPLKLVSPLVARIGQRLWDQRLTRIKGALEGSS